MRGQFLPGWWPSWLDLNLLVPSIATVVVIIVGVIVVCVAVNRKKSGLDHARRLRGEAELSGVN